MDDIILYFKHNISEIGFCLHLEMEYTQRWAKQRNTLRWAKQKELVLATIPDTRHQNKTQTTKEGCVVLAS
jgi:hypothetical protein